MIETNVLSPVCLRKIFIIINIQNMFAVSNNLNLLLSKIISTHHTHRVRYLHYFSYYSENSLSFMYPTNNIKMLTCWPVYLKLIIVPKLLLGSTQFIPPEAHEAHSSVICQTGRLSRNRAESTAFCAWDCIVSWCAEWKSHIKAVVRSMC